MLKLDRDSELMKTLHTELQPQESGSRKGVQDVTEHCFEENDYANIGFLLRPCTKCRYSTSKAGNASIRHIFALNQTK